MPVRPLAGLRVIDLAVDLGELCGRFLSDLGAEVVKAEPPSGSLSRRLPPLDGDHSLFFAMRNCGKLSAVVDLDAPDDSQPQILLQLLRRILRLGQSPGQAVSAGRWVLAPDGRADGFSTWRPGHGRKVLVEDPASGWASELAALGHTVEEAAPGAGFGHAHVIEATADGALAGAADPRSLTGAAAGL